MKPDIELEPIVVKNSGYVIVDKIIDGRDGNLCVIEESRTIPFAIRRVYYINHLENCVSIRGKHAHRRLQQVVFSINGSFTLHLDDGERAQDIHLFKDNVGVLLGPNLWHTMRDFSSGCILMVMASDYFDESDYIRDYDEFLQHVAQH